MEENLSQPQIPVNPVNPINPVPVPPVEPSAELPSPKRFPLKWILIIILVVATFSVGTYLIVKSQSVKQIPPPISQTPAQSTPTPTQTVSVEATQSANWKTYTNANGYSLQYPPSTISLNKPPFIQDSDIDKVSEITLSLKSSPRTGYFKPSMIIQVLDPKKEENEVNVSKADCKSYAGNTKFANLEEFAQLIYKNETNRNCTFFKSVVSSLAKNKFFDNYDSYKFTVESEALGGTDGGFLVPEGDMTYILSKVQDKYYLISFDSTEQIFTQILFTFKFTNSNQKSPVNLRGKVIKNDRGCDVDDLCILTIQDEKGGVYNIEYGGGFIWCREEPRGKVLVDDVKVGDMVEVYVATTVAGNNYLTICGNKEFFIREPIKIVR